MLERAVGGLQDRAAVKEVLLRYARAVDDRDFASVQSCFVDGAAIDGSLGKTSIEEYCQSLGTELSAYNRTMHFIGNQYVEVSGDKATLVSYAVAYHCVAVEPSAKDLIVGVRYHDEFVRRETTWMIDRRRVEPAFVGARFLEREGGGSRFGAQR
jgi:3-phenylpropionate/cinnamic acid dioxygenase small subunit